MDRPTVLYDACVLYPAWLRDLLLRLAIEEFCRALWSEEILDEVFIEILLESHRRHGLRLSVGAIQALLDG